MDLFENKKLYPLDEKTPLLEHFKEYFDTIKICFLPFFIVNKLEMEERTTENVQQITFEELKKEDNFSELFKNIEDINTEIFTRNKNYPSEKNISQNGKKVLWEEIIRETKLNSFREVNRALKTSIGAYKLPLRRFDLLKELEKYTKIHNIWHPSEEHFDFFTKRSIYRTFKLLGKEKIIIVEDYSKKKIVNIKDLTEIEFIQSIGYSDFQIYSLDNSILFKVRLDDFFYIIASTSKIMSFLNKTNEFEGFIVNNKDSYLWDWDEGEIDNILNKDKKKDEKYWWKGMTKK
jgi:hypothetical protein